MTELLAPKGQPKLFQCEVCQKEFNKKSNLQRHLLVHSDEPVVRKPHVCPHCQFNAATSFSLKVHIKRIHTKEFQHICSLCKKGYVLAGELRKHMMRHHPNEPIHIEENKDDSPILESSSDHLEIELKEDPSQIPPPNKPYCCHHCSKEFVKMNNLTKHLLVHAEDFVEKEHVCPHCQFKACSSSSLHVHIRRIHTKEFKHNCPHCNKGFAIPSELRRHVEFRHSFMESVGTTFDVMKQREEGLMCEICNRLFTSPSEIEEHRRKHLSMMAAKKHHCMQCDYATNYKADLKRHLRYHLGERPFRCEFCDKAFVEKGPLKIHLRLHTGESPFACPVCGRRFKRSASLQEHERTHSGDKPYLCDLCPKRFTTRTGFNLHRCKRSAADVLLQEGSE